MTIYGLIGYPIKHSLSAAMHNAAFKELGIEAEYRLFEIPPEKLEGFLLRPDEKFTDTEGKNISIGDLSGFNITIPYKVRAREILEQRYPYKISSFHVELELYYVKLSGAVNTVKRDVDGLIYRNTDAGGFLKSLKEDLGINCRSDLKNKNVFLIGCGGAGRAVIAALSWKEYKVKKIYVYEVNVEAIKSVKEHFSTLSDQWQKIINEKLEFVVQEQIPEKIKQCQLLVNASPIGMKEGDPSVFDKNLLHKDLYVYDVVYNRMTQLVRDTQEVCGKEKVCGGLGMLLYQGERALEFWIGRHAPSEVMRKALEEALNKK